MFFYADSRWFFCWFFLGWDKLNELLRNKSSQCGLGKVSCTPPPQPPPPPRHHQWTSLTTPSNQYSSLHPPDSRRSKHQPPRAASYHSVPADDDPSPVSVLFKTSRRQTLRRPSLLCWRRRSGRRSCRWRGFQLWNNNNNNNKQKGERK